MLCSSVGTQMNVLNELIIVELSTLAACGLVLFQKGLQIAKYHIYIAIEEEHSMLNIFNLHTL